MSTLVPFGGPVVVREIAVGAGDDADWTLASAIPAGAQFTHPGGPLHLTFETIDANGDPVAPATADFDYEVRQVVGASVFGGTVVENAVPNQRFVEGQSPDGGYAVRVINKANMPAGSTLLRIKAQAGDGTSELAIRTGTIAQLQALTSAQVSVGDVAWSKTHQRMVYVLTATASASTWAFRRAFRFYWSGATGSSALRYVQFGDGGVSATITGEAVIPMKFETRVESIRYAGDSDPGDTDISVHSARSGTPLETSNQATTGAATPKDFDFTATATIPADGELSISIDPTGAPAAFNLEIIGNQVVTVS